MRKIKLNAFLENKFQKSYELAKKTYKDTFGREFHKVQEEYVDSFDKLGEIKGRFDLRYYDNQIKRWITYAGHALWDLKETAGLIVHENGGHSEFTFLIPQDLLFNYAKCETQVRDMKTKPTFLCEDVYNDIGTHSEAFSRILLVKTGLSTFPLEKLHLRGYDQHGLIGLLFDAYDCIPSSKTLTLPQKDAWDIILSATRSLGVENSDVQKLHDIEKLMVFDASLYDKNLICEFASNREELEKEVVGLLKLYSEGGRDKWISKEYPNLAYLSEK